MTLLVDTSVWSLAFRRDHPRGEPEVDELRRALGSRERVVTTGIVVQELLQGVRGPKQSERLLERLRVLPVLTPEVGDHVEAASVRNRCRRRGVQLGTIDALLAALCLSHGLTLLTTDRDFHHAAKVVPLDVWGP